MFPSHLLGSLALPAWLLAAPAQAFEVDGRVNGAWFDPTHRGEGWVVEVLGDTAVVYWFTYPPIDAPGEQAWIQGVGHVEGNALVITETVITRGPAFGADYDLADLEDSPWGTWAMTFDGCDSGTVQYHGDGEFGSGTFDIERLSMLQGSPCAQDGDSDPAVTGFSGSWFEQASAGQGITLEVLNGGAALLYWFTYTPTGEQAWVLGVGTADGGRFEFPEMLMPAGTRFGAGFDPEAVEELAWGAVSLTFDACGNGVMNYRADLDGWDSGWLAMERLTGLDGHPCELAPAPPLNRGSWGAALSMSPAVSEVGTAVLDRAAYTAGDLGANQRSFTRFDPNANRFTRLADLPSRRHHAMMAAHGGHIYLFGGFDSSFISTDSAWRYDLGQNRWDVLEPLPGPVAASAAVTLDDRIYLITQGGAVWRLDPAAMEWRVLSSPGTVRRDHGSAVAFRGEIWWLAGRNFAGSHRSVDIFDPVTRVWRPGPPMLRGRSGFAAAVVGDQIMVAGGEHPSAPPEPWTLERTLEVYSPRMGGWFRGPDVPVPVHGVGGASLNGRFYLLGGSTLAGSVDNPGIAQVYVPGD